MTTQTTQNQNPMEHSEDFLSHIKNKERVEKTFQFYVKMMQAGLKYGFSDIVFSEWEFPYMIDSSRNVYEYEVEIEGKKGKYNFEKVYRAKINNDVLSKDDIADLFLKLQDFSVLEGLSEKFKANLGVDFAVRINGTKLRCNLSNFKGRRLELVCRVIPSEDAKTLEDLGLISQGSQVYKNVLNNMEGLILVVGPTGSGKSTTLTAMIDEVNRNEGKHIVTLEDPVEYEHTNKKSKIVQREVGTDILSYADGMKFILRQKPHIVVVGETRTADVMKVLVELSMTGHLCLTTFHSKSVMQTLSRMETFYSEGEREGLRADIAEIIIAIFVQHLIPKKWGGKVLLKEIMVATDDIRRAIRERDEERLLKFIENGAKKGMTSTDQSLLELFEADLITGETFAHYAVDKEFAETHTGIGQNRG